MTVQVAPARNPYRKYCEFADARGAGDDDSLLLVPFTYRHDWRDQEPVDLVAVYFFSGDVVQYGVVTIESHSLDYWDVTYADVQEALRSWLAKLRSPLFLLHQPLPLQTVSVPKPWGQEVWYTGVEPRGIACFGSEGLKTPIPYLLAVMPSIKGDVENGPLILLKVLDPLPEEVFGDLYFELHEKKQEVYVVTHVDKRAWPDGVGRMWLGFDPRKLQNDTEFRQQFLQQVLAYREVRQEIDGLLDQNRQQQGFALSEEVPVDCLKRWLEEVPASLADREMRLRRAMESYYGSLPLQVGDVVKVPLNVPHALQHGVRTIEFQTPVYERQIIAFGQKVLTQHQWDTERAVTVMELATPSHQQLPLLLKEEALQVEQVVEFDDFQVHRVTLASSTTYRVPSSVYRLLIVIQGTLTIGEIQVAEEEAVLLPVSPAEVDVKPICDQEVVFLLACPNMECRDGCRQIGKHEVIRRNTLDLRM